MNVPERLETGDAMAESVDERVVLHGAAWADYLRILDLRGDRSA